MVKSHPPVSTSRCKMLMAKRRQRRPPVTRLNLIITNLNKSNLTVLPPQGTSIKYTTQARVLKINQLANKTT